RVCPSAFHVPVSSAMEQMLPREQEGLPRRDPVGVRLNGKSASERSLDLHSMASSASSWTAEPPVPTRSMPRGRLMGMPKGNEELFEVAHEGVQRLSEHVADSEQKALQMAKEVIDEMRRPQELDDEVANGSLTWEEIALPQHTRIALFHCHITRATSRVIAPIQRISLRVISLDLLVRSKGERAF
ncbi:unnamed protein product, partial [Durusdinium trenchii]